MRVDLFDFHLPPGHIAERPMEPREKARLLCIAPEGMTDALIADLPDTLRPGDLLITNDTRVIPARLFGMRGEAKVEVLLHRQLSPLRWEVFAKPAKRLREGDVWRVADDLWATVHGRTEQGLVILEFSGGEDAFWPALERYGSMPLPPYIQRAADDDDKTDYQTVFADKPGSVAAPTASLHFTPELLARLEASGIRRASVTLHVGAGTFLPVKAEDTSDHHMHSEIYNVPADTAEAIAETRRRGGRVVAVGTTALRTLESVAAGQGLVRPGQGETAIFITPGYIFQVVDGLMTNFHLPKSTLFMLVSAFAGLEEMQRAYRHAIEAGYRFFSYGDACLLWRR